MTRRLPEAVVMEILFLRCVYGLPVRAIAKRLGMSRRTVRQLLGSYERGFSTTTCERTVEPSGLLRELGDLARLLVTPICDD